MDVTGVAWRKSSYSGSNGGTCVEVGTVSSTVAVRDSKDPDGQVLAFAVLTASEVMVSVTHLEFAYTQAPKKMKSLVMCTYLGTISLGNLFTSGINFLIERGVLKLHGAAYFFFFVVVMFITALLFLVFARLYKGKMYLQDEA